MKPSEIIKLARRQTWCTEDIVTTEEAYKFLNFIIEDFWADIRNSDSWYWYDVLQIPVVWGQVQYTFTETPWIMSEKFPMHKIQAVRIKKPDWKWRDLPVHFVDKVDINKFENQWEPKVCFITRKEINLIPMPKENSSLQIWGWNYNQPIFQDIWKITVNSVEYTRSPNNDVDWTPYAYAWEALDSIIYTDSPKPTTWNAYEDYKWTTLAWTIDAYDVEVMDSEDNIWIDKRWHYVIVEWLKYRMYGNMWVNFEAARNNSRAFYDSEKNKAIQNIVDRW
jgi:hypothetical protein